MRVLVISSDERFKVLFSGQLPSLGALVDYAKEEHEAGRFMAEWENFGLIIHDHSGSESDKDLCDRVELIMKKKSRAKQIWVVDRLSQELMTQALRYQVAGYLKKPFDAEEFASTVNRVLSEYGAEREHQISDGRLEARLGRLEGREEDRYRYTSQSPAMEKVNEFLIQLRRETMKGLSDESPVLLLGESGTEKEGIARMIHLASSRGQGAWLSINCATFNQQLLGSELFGHEKGAFYGARSSKMGLFEIAQGGTLFLEQVTELDLSLQGRLVQVLEQKMARRFSGEADYPVDVRLILTANLDFSRAISQGRFREDLYQILSRVRIHVPALRERPEDIIPFARQFAEKGFRAHNKIFYGFMPDSEQVLKNYSWPGNIHELRNVVERAALLWEEAAPIPSQMLTVERMDQVTHDFKSKQQHFSDFQSFMELKRKWIDAFEREYLISVVERNRGNVTLAAREARMDRSNFLRLLRRHQMKARDLRVKKVA